MNTIPEYRLEPPPAPNYPSCPVCGSEMYDYIILDINNDAVGCSECAKEVTADDYLDILEEEKW